ncbi:MAG: RsmB/NOP family class I SAM-dependent RNA methyltransferase [Candidatus Puniceispirillales bacterium]
MKSKHRQPEPARQIALSGLKAIMSSGQALDEWLEKNEPYHHLEPRDRRFCRRLLASSLRHHGQARLALRHYIPRPPKGRQQMATYVLLLALTELIWLDGKSHAVVDQSVRLIRSAGLEHLHGLVNASLRRCVKDIDSHAEWVTRWRHDHAANFPDWIKTRLIADWGKEKANDIMAASLMPPPLDLTMAEHGTADIWAEKLGGYVLPKNSVRLNEGTPHRLDGYADGKWWVQDAAATLPFRIMGDIGGKHIIDACAAPGGKCAQLIAGGADVTAIDQSASRLERLKENLTRLQMDATVINTDILSWSPDAPVDAVLIDAPCSATGTIRRNPDKLVHQKTPDITKLAELQMAMITHAATWLKPGGVLVFATCSLFRAEGEDIAARIATETDLLPDAIDPHIYDGFEPCAGNDAHMLRLFPDALKYPANASNHIKDKNAMIHGNDGFFMARFYRR